MKKLDEIKSSLAAHKKELKEKYKIKSIGIFGSYVRQEQKKRSDVDILVEFDESAGAQPFGLHRLRKPPQRHFRRQSGPSREARA